MNMCPGVVVPEAEAHRHEPPNPHDKVKVDTKKNDEELQVNRQPVNPESQPNGELEHAGDSQDKKEEKAEEKQKPAEAIIGKEEVNLGGGDKLSNEILEKPDGLMKQDPNQLKDVVKRDSVKEPLAGNAANQAAVVQADRADAQVKRTYMFSNAKVCKNVINYLLSYVTFV